MRPGPNWLAGMLHDLDRRGTAVAGAHSKVLHTSGKIKHAGYKWGAVQALPALPACLSPRARQQPPNV
jgi:hypothetical protein